MNIDLRTRSQRLGWFKSTLVRKDKGDKVIVILTVIGVVALMLANLMFHYGLRLY